MNDLELPLVSAAVMVMAVAWVCLAYLESCHRADLKRAEGAFRLEKHHGTRRSYAHHRHQKGRTR